MSTEELLEKTSCKLLSSEVKQRRWKIIGHILQQDHTNKMNVAMTCASEGRRKGGRPKTNMAQNSGKRKSRSWMALMPARHEGDRNRNRNLKQAGYSFRGVVLCLCTTQIQFDSKVESIWIKVELSHQKPLYMASLYRPPNHWKLLKTLSPDFS